MTRTTSYRVPFSPRLEPLEDRTLLATCTVTNLLDIGRGALSFATGQVTGDLRFCINHANAMPGPDVIDFAVAGTINLTRALPSISDDLAIVGPGASQLVTDANDNGRAFTVDAGIDVQLYALTIQNGTADLGGGIRNSGTLTLADVIVDGNVAERGGGIHNNGTLTVYGSTISDNRASRSTHAKGGGIYNRGTLNLFNSTIAGNSIDGGTPMWGAGIASELGSVTIMNSVITANTGNTANGGGIYTLSGLTTISDTIIFNNTSAYGGGISSHSTLVVERCTISTNIANTGGGIGVDSSTATVVSSTIVDNTSTANGGGGINNNGPLTVINSTIARNSAPGAGGGGGIYSNGHLILKHTTISENSASSGGGVMAGGNNLNDLRNSIIAGNSAATFPDFKGWLNSSFYNIYGSSDGGANQSGTDLIDVDPMLGPLQDNGGPTLTHALLPGSPAIDAGDNTNAPDFDQRGPGFPRIVNGTIDIGAFEVQASIAGGQDHFAALVSALVTEPIRKVKRLAAS